MKFIQDQARQWLALLAVIGVAVVVYYAGWLRPIEHWLSLIVQPTMSLTYAAIDSYSPLYSTTDSTLLAENRTMKDQLASLVQQNHDLQQQQKQYEEYSAELAFAQERDYTLQPAKVLTRVGDSTVGQWLYINIGNADNVQVGYPIIYGPGLMLGVITAVHESYSEVRLITNDDSAIQAKTQAEDATSGLVVGQFGTSLLLQYILKDYPLQAGDMIVTNGQDQYIPAGLIIGTVEQVVDASSELFKSATVTSMVRYGNNAIVSVVIPKNL
ncbi:MAG: rod shape-determining protein MreC [Patescibacteria group bacterium]|jgi:rod shape-determining protein MreC